MKLRHFSLSQLKPGTKLAVPPHLGSWEPEGAFWAPCPLSCGLRGNKDRTQEVGVGKHMENA